MHRATPANSSFRAYTAGGARSVVHEVDDSKEMQEGKGNFMKGETSEGIESPQNYGFTSVVMDGDKDKDGNLTDGPETFVSYMGGNRSFPVNGPMDDRRHRLKGLEKGDVAMFRTKDDNQQFHLTGDGGFWSAPTDKTVRMQLVKKQDQQQGGQQGGGGSSRAADGGGSSGGQQGQQGQQSQRGQKAVRKNSSHQYVDVTQDKTNVSGSNCYLRLQDGNGYVHASADKKVWVGAEKGKASFARLLTENGPSVNSYGALSTPSAVAVADPRYPTPIEPPAPTVPPEIPPEDLPLPQIPDRCFYAETTWFDAHVLDDAWKDFAGNPGQGTAPTYAPFHFFRSDVASQAPSPTVLGKGALGLNGHDGILFWLNNAGAVEQAALRQIANVPGLLALMQFVRVTPIQATQWITLDTRTNHVLIFLWGGSAGSGSDEAGDPGDGGTTSLDGYFAATGGTHSVFNIDTGTAPGADGIGAGGDINLTGCGAKTPPSSMSGSGGLAIKFLAIAGGTPLSFTIGVGGHAGGGPHAQPGAHGGALIFEMT